MNWSDEGFLLGKNRYNENSLIVEIFTKEKGKVSGIIFGGTSKKIKNYLQIGNKIKAEELLGIFKEYIEESEPKEEQETRTNYQDLGFY